MANGSFQTGKEVERELLGVVGETKEKREKQRAFELLTEIESAMFDVKERGRQNPINPERPFANMVRTKIADELEFDEKLLKYYTALSADPNRETRLDHDFGIDAFFELELENGKSFDVTIDLTLRRYKENPKASITFSIPDDFPLTARFEKGQIKGLTESEWRLFDQTTDDLAKQIAEKFKKLLSLK